jgi:hypothetical protein
MPYSSDCHFLVGGVLLQNATALLTPHLKRAFALGAHRQALAVCDECVVFGRRRACGRHERGGGGRERRSCGHRCRGFGVHTKGVILFMTERLEGGVIATGRGKSYHFGLGTRRGSRSLRQHTKRVVEVGGSRFLLFFDRGFRTFLGVGFVVLHTTLVSMQCREPRWGMHILCPLSLCAQQQPSTPDDPSTGGRRWLAPDAR